MYGHVAHLIIFVGGIHDRLLDRHLHERRASATANIEPSDN